MNKKLFRQIFYYCALFLIGMAFSSCDRNGEMQFKTTNSFAPFRPSQNLERDFKDPPDQARPWAFWWWLEGNIDKKGIREDLIAMKEVGLHGALIYDAGSSSYRDVRRIPPGPRFMSKQWRENFAYAVKVADSLGLEMSMNITSGWNDGGPWVVPEYAAKKLVWRKMEVTGPTDLDQKLPLPDDVFVWKMDSQSYFWPVVVLAMPAGDSSDKLKPLKYFNQKAVHNISVPLTHNGYNWDIFLQEDSSSIYQHSVRLENIINISKKVDSTGHIHWKVPEGDYAIYWFGYTGTGSRVSTSSPGGEGLAIDYMDTAATNLQFRMVSEVLINDVKSYVGKSLMYLHDDSWELGAANWTPGFLKAFKKLRGYDPTLYLPIIAGEIINNKNVSNRFLYDFRRTIADLIAKNHYKKLKILAHKNGLGVHPESGGPHPAPIDALKNLGIDDIPMGEFWAKVKTHRVQDYRRIYIKQSASAAHTYGRRYVQAEGPTSIGPQWEMDPRRLKPTIDRAFCEGMNRLVFHTFTHSPDSAGKPGYEYFAGSHFNPNITWWEQAPAYVNYVSRCQMLLQQGAFVADVCYYYGNNVPNQVHLKRINPSLGEGYDYDYVDTQILLDSMFVKEGRIFLKNGMHYEVLVLPDRKTIPLKVLKKVEQLVAEGATVIGPKPMSTFSLTGFPRADKQIKKIADNLWGTDTSLKEKSFGKGKVVWGKSIRQVLMERGIRPDFRAEGKKQLEDVDYIHRRYNQYDIYFISNRKDTAQWFTADFRVTGKMPELWHPDNGKIVLKNVYSVFDDYTSLPLYLPAYGSVFVVFKNDIHTHIERITRDGKNIYPFKVGNANISNHFTPQSGNKISFNNPGNYILHFSNMEEKQVSMKTVPSSIALMSDWRVHFDTSWGGPATVTFNTLISWPDSKLKGIKYYSGTAVYHNHFQLDKKMVSDQLSVILDLNRVYNLAEVKVNGKRTKTLWKYPFSMDITPYVKPGINSVQIKVVNMWPNRIIGDFFLPAAQRYTHTNVIKFDKDYPLLPSGLIGPVEIKFKPVYNL